MTDILDQIKEMLMAVPREGQGPTFPAVQKGVLEERYEVPRGDFENDKFTEAVENSSGLMRKLLIEIINRHYRILSSSQDFLDAIEQLKKTYKDKPNYLTESSLLDICSVYDSVRIFDILAEAGEGEEEELRAYKDHQPLLRTFNWKSLADVCEVYKAYKGPGSDVILSIQQVLCAIAALLCVFEHIQVDEYYRLANFSHMTEEIMKIRDSQTKLSDVESKLSYLKSAKMDVDVRRFEWIKLRGMLINTGDGSRNISFKVESMLNIFSTICDGIDELIRSKADPSISSRAAYRILSQAGYQSGSRFGWTMHEIFQRDAKTLSPKEKIQKWCEFDSDVGFGLLHIQGDENPKITSQEADDVEYKFYEIKIELLDNFLTFKREASERNLCSFMSGYIQGVLEKVTGQPLVVTHAPTDCSQLVADLDQCIFYVTTNTEKLVQSFKQAKQQYVERSVPSAMDSDTPVASGESDG